MNENKFESNGSGFQENEQIEKTPRSGALREGEKPDLMIKMVDLLIGRNFNKVEVKGEENLELIPRDRKVIFVPTHLSDFDVPMTISVIGKHFHVSVGDASTHHKITENTGAFFGNTLVNLATLRKNFYPVEHRNKDGVEKGKFNPEDFEGMKEIFEQDKSLVISAYYKGGQGWELPDKGGYGAVYLAEMEDALIVPVAVNIRSEEQIGMGNTKLKTLMKKPDAEVSIGVPVELEDIPGIERIKEIMEKRKSEKLSHDEVEEFHRLRLDLRDKSDLLMGKLAELLPEEKRGRWNGNE